MNWTKNIAVAVICLICMQPASGGWTRQPSGTLAWLKAVYFVDDVHGWIGGSKGTLLATSDGGSTWRQTRSYTDDTIRDVYFSDPSNGWLLCSRDVYQSGAPSYLLRTGDGGASWQRVDFDPATARMHRFFFYSDGTGYAVGEGGTVWQLPPDAKQKWKSSALPVRYLILGGSFVDASNLVLVGGGGTILFTVDGGSEWTTATMTEKPGGKFNSVHFANVNNGWAVGDKGAVYFSNNGGKLWRRQNSGVVESLFDVRFIDAGSGFAVGDKGVILRSGENGSWSREPAVTPNRLERLFFVRGRGFAVGFGGEILTYKPDGTKERLKVVGN